MTRILIPLLLALLPTAGMAQQAANPPDQPVFLDLPDSLTTITVESGVEVDTLLAAPVMRVRGERLHRSTAPGETRLGASVLETTGGPSAAELGKLLPSTRMNVNSRGEALFMVRGASERHLPVYLDLIPLVVPWDERADLSLVPAAAVGGVVASRGTASALDGPNAVAGRVRLLPRTLAADGRRTELLAQGGEAGAKQGHLLHLRRQGPWSLLAALAHRERDAFLIPADLEAAFHQGDGFSRTNSDLRQSSLLLRLERRLSGGGRASLLVQGSDAEKGVPPETHLEDARFWRYPEVRRGLAGLAVALRPEGWRVDAGASLDLFRQEIRPYEDARYLTPALLPGVELERDRDRTAYGSLRVERDLSPSTVAAVQGVLRHTRHRETLVVDGPELAYAQRLLSLTGEGRWAPDERWLLRAGGGWELASTPETGDKPSRERTDAAVLHAGAEREIGGGARMRASLARRSRFPSLRELYSGALGRFVPNPELRPERQDSAELGFTWQGRRLELDVAGFVTQLDGGIEKMNLPDGLFQRVNVDLIRTLGMEFVGAWRVGGGLTLRGQHSFLHARREIDGRFDGFVEDRPAYLSRLAAELARPNGLRVTVEALLTGPRQSLDARDESGDGLHRLPAQSSWNLRVGWRRFLRADALYAGEVFLYLQNAFDQALDSQWGLPEPGRTLYLGLRLTRSS